MRSTRIGHPGLLTTSAVLVLGTVLVACAGAGYGPQAARPGASEAPQPADAAGEPAFRSAVGEEAGDQAFQVEAQIAERQIIKVADLTLRVEEIGPAIGRVRALAVELGGYVSGSESSGEQEYATLTLRIPADSFDRALEDLHDLAVEVVAEATREEDVTTQVIDLEARIKNLSASEAQYRALIDRATDVEDVLAIQRRLDEVRGEIEQMTAQLEYLTRQAALSTVTVTLVVPDRPVQTATASFDPGATFDQAVAALVEIGQAIVNGAIWFAIVWLPVLAVLAVLGLVALRVFGVVRRRLPHPAEPPVA